MAAARQHVLHDNRQQYIGAQTYINPGRDGERRVYQLQIPRRGELYEVFGAVKHSAARPSNASTETRTGHVVGVARAIEHTLEAKVSDYSQ